MVALATGKKERLPLDKAQEIVDKFDERKFYAVTFQLGANRRWREFNNGRWEPDPSKDDPQRQLRGLRHVPAVHTADHVPGAIVNGLVSIHNDFLRANRERDQRFGDVNRMLLVLDVVESHPPRAIVNLPPGFEEMMAAMIKTAAESAAVAAVNAIANVSKGQPAPKAAAKE